MKAIVYRRYGSPDVLSFEEVEKPVPRADEVLVKVHATSINDWDWGLLRGRPFINRIQGIFRPKYKILGSDIAGRVEAVGIAVSRFQPGDEVFGDLSRDNWGGFAEYACARENALAPKPANMTFDEAAAVPQAGVLALQGMNDKVEIKPGQHVLINGAGGGAGSFAVQIAKLMGAEVTGVDNAEKLNSMRSVGADHVIDYTREDFTRNGLRYDLILDMAAHHSIFDYRRALNPGGTYVMEGGATMCLVQIAFLGPWFSRFGSKKMSILLHQRNKGLAYLTELLETGKIAPVIDRRYPLSETPDAFRYFGGGHHRGKIVITV